MGLATDRDLPQTYFLKVGQRQMTRSIRPQQWYGEKGLVLSGPMLTLPSTSQRVKMLLANVLPHTCTILA